jgi:hypothetical protein
MIKFKDSEAKMSTPKRNITIENVHVEGECFVDEHGNIVPGLLELLPAEIEEFTIKISLPLPIEDESDDN